MVGSRRKAVMEPFQGKQLCYGSWSKHRCLELQGAKEQSHPVCWEGLPGGCCRVRQQIPARDELWDRHGSPAWVSPAVLASWLPCVGLRFWLGAGNLWNGGKKPPTWPESLLGVFIRVKSQGLIPHVSLGNPTFAHSFKP